MWGFNPKTIDMSHSEVMSLLPRELVDFGSIESTDRMYQVPMVESLDYIMRKVPSWKYTYAQNTMDCDDFVRIFRGWLSMKGFGNLLAIDTEVTLPHGVRHNLISFMDLERKDRHNKHPLIFGEPQTGKLVSGNYTGVKLKL